MSKSNQESFQTSSLQIGNLKRTLSEAADGSLVFRDAFFPQGVKLKDLNGAAYIVLQEELIGISGYLQSEIDYIQFEIDEIYGMTNLAGISAYLQTQITDNRNEVISISGYLQDEIVYLDTVLSTVTGITASLDGRKMDKVIGGVTGNLVEIGISGNSADSGIPSSEVILSQLVSITANDVDGWKVLDQLLCVSAPEIVEWQIFSYNVDYTELKYASRIMGIYSCVNSEIDYTEYAILNIGGQPPVPIQVVFNGSYIQLQVQGSSTLQFNSKRIITARDVV